MLSGDAVLGEDRVLGVRDELSPGRASRGPVAVLPGRLLPGRVPVEPPADLVAFWELIDAQYGDPALVCGGQVVDSLDDFALV